MKKLSFLFLLILSTSCRYPVSAHTSAKSAHRASHLIGVMAALPEELSELIAALEDAHEAKKGDATIMAGKLGEVDVVITLSGIGKVNAAAAAQRLISEYAVAAVIFIGVAGGIHPSYEIGDVAIGSQAFQHDFGMQTDHFVLHAVGSFPEFGIGAASDPIPFDLNAYWPPFSAGETFLEMVATFFKTLEQDLVPVEVDAKSYRPMIRSRAMVATGDQFIASNLKKKELRKLDADLVEMEGAAVAQVAAKNHRPCMLIRAVSDKAGSTAKINFADFFKVGARNNAILLSKLFTDDGMVAYLNSLAQIK